MEGTKVAIVTGSNKGIGFAIVRSLCKTFKGDVFLTARDQNRGLEAIKSLAKEGLKPMFHQLDIEDENSIHKLANYIKEKYGGIDILVNNAGIAYKMDSTAPFAEQAEVTLKCNYWGTLSVSNILFPLLRSHARVVHVSSLMSQMSFKKCSDDLKKKLLALTSINEVSAYMTKFVRDVNEGKYKAEGWPEMAYGVSKIGVTLLAPIQQKIMDADTTRSDIIINSCCPGYVATDMSSFKGPKSIDEGADTPVYLALLPENATEPRGKFVSERKVESIDK